MSDDSIQAAVAAAAPLDIGSVRTITTAEVEIVHPLTFVGLGAWFLLAGPEHPVRKRASLQYGRKLRDRALALGESIDADLQVDDDAETEVLVVATLGWRGPIVDGVARPPTFRGEPLPYSAEAARKLYTDPDCRWLRNQVRDALERRRLFIQGSPAT